jgi:hypothetical protein
MRSLILAVLCAMPVVAIGHPGGLNAEGCHNNRKTGDYHCHRAASNSAVPKPPPEASGGQPRHLVPQAGAAAAAPQIPGRPACYVGPRGGTYTITASGRKNYPGC